MSELNFTDEKTSYESSLQTIVNNPVDRDILKGFIDEVLYFQKIIEDARNSLKDIRSNCKDKLGLKPKQLNMLVRDFKDAGAAGAQEDEWAEVAIAADVLRGDKA